MKKGKILLSFLMIFSFTLAITQSATPQVGTYTFSGAPGNQKILKVTTVNSTSLTALFGANWDDILQEFFGLGCHQLGARLKSVVVSVNTSAKFDTSTLFLALGVLDVAVYVTNSWNWTTGSFANTPDSYNQTVMSFYDPDELTAFVQAFYATWYFMSVNVSIQNAGAYFAQLPTPVPQYLGAIVWEDKWENIGNTVTHHAEVGDFLVNYLTLDFYAYLENCTETWTYDTTYGAWIGYNIKDNEGNVIYEFSIELPSGAEIAGYELPIVIGVASIGIISLIFIVMKKKR